MKRAILALATLAITASGALAYGQKTIEANEAIQANRIEQGRLTGQLTKKEYRDLKAEQAHIQAMEARAKADGHISKSEYNRIHDAQINAYRNIKDDSSNGKVNVLRRWLSNHR